MTTLIELENQVRAMTTTKHLALSKIYMDGTTYEYTRWTTSLVAETWVVQTHVVELHQSPIVDDYFKVA